MASLDERVAYLERRMEVHTALVADMRADLRGLRAELRAEIAQLRAETRADLGELGSDLRRIDHKIDRHFTWLVGALVAVLLALIGLAFQIARLQPL